MAELVKSGMQVRPAGTFEIRNAEAGGRYLEGVAATFDQWNDVGPYDEALSPEVFATSLSRSRDRINLHVQHDIEKVAVGKPVEWHPSDTELRGVWKFDTRDEAQEAARLAAEGFLPGLSVHFIPGKKAGDNVVDTHEGRDRVRRVRNARLMEVSLVTVPAYEDAHVSLVRGASVSELEQLRELAGTPRLDAARALLASLRA